MSPCRTQGSPLLLAGQQERDCSHVLIYPSCPSANQRHRWGWGHFLRFLTNPNRKNTDQHLWHKQLPEMCVQRSKLLEAIFLCRGDALTSWPHSQRALPH